MPWSTSPTLPSTRGCALPSPGDSLLEVRDLGEEARQKVPAAEVKSFFSSFSIDE